MAKKPKKDDPEQSQRFVETAKELGADKDEKSFEKALKIITPKAGRSRPSGKQSSS